MSRRTHQGDVVKLRRPLMTAPKPGWGGSIDVEPTPFSINREQQGAGLSLGGSGETYGIGRRFRGDVFSCVVRHLIKVGEKEGVKVTPKEYYPFITYASQQQTEKLFPDPSQLAPTLERLCEDGTLERTVLEPMDLGEYKRLPRPGLQSNYDSKTVTVALDWIYPEFSVVADEAAAVRRALGVRRVDRSQGTLIGVATLDMRDREEARQFVLSSGALNLLPQNPLVEPVGLCPTSVVAWHNIKPNGA